MTNRTLDTRGDADFLSRSIPGVIIYIFAWPIAAIGSNFYATHPAISLGIFLLFSGISVLRLAHFLVYKKYGTKHPVLLRHIMLFLAYCHALSWGGLLTLSTVSPEFASLNNLLSITVICIAAGAISSLNPRPVFSQVYCATMLLPPSFASVVTGNYTGFTIVMSIGAVYFYFMGVRYSKEYQRAIHTELELQQRQTELEHLLDTDSLTRVYNRKYFDREFEKQWQLAARNQTELGMLLLDIDHFKRVNDTHGHSVGDACIVHVAKIIKQTVKRTSDIIARYGGEEFVILFPHCNKDKIIELAQEIRSNIELSPYVSKEEEFGVTISGGFASIIPNKWLTKSSLFDSADDALYHSKNEGRNRISVSQSKTEEIA